MSIVSFLVRMCEPTFFPFESWQKGEKEREKYSLFGMQQIHEKETQIKVFLCINVKNAKKEKEKIDFTSTYTELMTRRMNKWHTRVFQ